MLHMRLSDGETTLDNDSSHTFRGFRWRQVFCLLVINDPGLPSEELQ